MKYEEQARCSDGLCDISNHRHRPNRTPGQAELRRNLEAEPAEERSRPDGAQQRDQHHHQTGDQIKVTTASDSQFGKLTYSFTAKLDGTDTPAAATDFPSDAPFQILTSKAEWKDNSLIVTQNTSFQDAKGTLASTYTISADGKTLTKATHIKFDQGEFDSKSVYDKA